MTPEISWCACIRRPPALRSARWRVPLGGSLPALPDVLPRDAARLDCADDVTRRRGRNDDCRNLDSAVTANGEAAGSFSHDARAIASAARSWKARLTAASSASPVLSPVFGWTPVTPMKSRLARSFNAAANNAAPVFTMESLSDRVPSMTNSLRGSAANSTATSGLCVITATLRPESRYLAIWMAVVPPSRNTPWLL